MTSYNVLLQKIVDRTCQAMNIDINQLRQFVNEDERVLHDPFLYDGMSELIDRLYQFKLKQQNNPGYLLVVDTDYDSDGIMSAAVLSAALDVFNINFRVYIPSMADDYGLSVKAVEDMRLMFNDQNYTVSMILTADNGTNAIAGVQRAKDYGIEVLVTDHHLGNDSYANADVIVNPNKVMPDGSVEPYPFKGNAGATVAWKTMLAYAQRYQPQSYQLIYDLIVFAGIANVADVMPIVDENHFMVRKSVEEIQRLTKIRQTYRASTYAYNDVKSTPYIHYNSVFYGLYDIIRLLQESKDEKRQSENKDSIPLPTNEELISWYISPMLNAPRRVNASSKEAMLSVMDPRLYERHENIRKMIAMNERKTLLRNAVLNEINIDELKPNFGNVLFVNAQHGISGLIAGQIAEKTGRATMVFALPTELPEKVYNGQTFQSRFDYDTLVIGCSARSTEHQPLNVIMNRIKEIRPDIVVGGGGHAAAAGYKILYKHYDTFVNLFNLIAERVLEEVAIEMRNAVDKGLIQVKPKNTVRLSFYNLADNDEYIGWNVTNDTNFKQNTFEVYQFQEQLRPFGKDFEGQTEFLFDIDPTRLQNYDFKPNFWKTFKFTIHGVDVLTFDIDLSTEVKSAIASNNPTIIQTKAELKINEFGGKQTPQFVLSR